MTDLKITRVKDISVNIAGGGASASFNRNLSFESGFIPSRMVVRQIVFRNSVALEIVVKLFSSITNGVLGCFSADTDADPQTTFDLRNRQINFQEVRFEIRNFDDTINTTIAGNLCFILEFSS